MLGILSYGLNLPFYRLPRKFIFEAMGWYNPGLAGLSGGQKAVANHDEDSLTLAVAAGIDALDRVERSQIEALYLASTTLPYAERSNAAIAAEALNLDPQTRTAELGGALKAGTSALIAALQEKDSGPKLVCASDCRLARAGGVQEPLTGDGAAAFVVGQGQVIAEFEESFSLSHDFADQRRLTSRSFLNSWEERWIRTEGYAQFLPQVINGLLDKAGLK
ncbi:MAG: hydroxymethylglutaryl-CoA synthase family protein, partial [Deltaproteobacteria bacterium]|nr:hydroxymethylglutaryl-CoA synthase family protein [Deltaproteobacteria bacterium]